MIHTKCPHCNHLNYDHHIYCPLDDKELWFWHEGYTDGLAQHPHQCFAESAKQKVYNLGYDCGTADFENKSGEAEMIALMMLRLLEKEIDNGSD